MNILQKAKYINKFINNTLAYTLKAQVRGRIKVISIFHTNTLFQKGRFAYSANIKLNEKDFLQLIDKNYSEMINSENLMNQFQEKINLAIDINVGMEMCSYYLEVFKKRMEHQKGILVCKTTLDLLNNYNLDPFNSIIGYFSFKEMVLNYEMGNFNESKRIANHLYELFKNQKYSPLATELRKKCAKEMIYIQEYDLANKYVQDIINHIELNQNHEINAEDLFEITHIYSGSKFVNGNLLEAAKYSKLTYELIMESYLSISNPQNFLITAYVCYKELKKVDQANEILEELQKYPEINDNIKQLEEYTKQTFNPFTSQFYQDQEVKQMMQKEKLQEQEGRSSRKNIVWSKENDSVGLSYLKNKQLDKGIEYYESIFKQLDPELDQLQQALVLDRIAEFYCHKSNFDKAIELSLKAHQILLKKRNNILFGDFETLLNLNHLKNYYVQNKDYDSAFKWGQKWHTYCLLRNYFFLFDENILVGMFFHQNTLKNLNKLEEALEYNKFISNHIQKFQKQVRGSYIIQIEKDKLDILKQLEKYEEARESAKRLCELLKPYKNQNKEVQKLFYESIKEAAFLCIQTKDFVGKTQFGIEYFKVRPYFEKENDHIKERQILMIRVLGYYLNHKFLDQAEMLVADGIKTLKIQNNPIFALDLNLVQIEILTQKQEFSKIDNILQESNKVIENHLKQYPEYGQMKIILLQISSIIHFYQKDYERCLQEIEKSFQNKLAINQEFFYSQQLEILTWLESNSDYKDRVLSINQKYKLKIQQ